MRVDILPQAAMVFILIFARLGGLLMLMPALGESSIPARVRLGFGLLLAFVFYPFLYARFGTIPQSLASLGLILLGEIVIGLAMGLALRLTTTVLQVAGATIAMQLSLSFAEAADPTQRSHSPVVTNFLMVTAVTLIFVTDLHHIALAGMVDAYTLFPPGSFPAIGDFGTMSLTTVAEAFRVGLQVSAPFIVFGLIFQLGLGVLSRLMPQVQIFFLSMPVSIGVGLLLIMLLCMTIFTWYLGHIETVFRRFLVM